MFTRFFFPSVASRLPASAQPFLLFLLFLACTSLPHAAAQQALVDFSTLSKGRVGDIDGNSYPTILFGDTWWMAKNLRTYRFSDGTPLTYYQDMGHTDYNLLYNTEYSTGGANYDGLHVEAHYAYPMRSLKHVSTYGLLYPYHAAISSHGLCPQGWYFPDTADWFTLARLVVGDQAFEDNDGYQTVHGIGKFFKTDNGGLWTYSPTAGDVTGDAGINIVPAGRLYVGGYADLGEKAYFWTPNYVHPDGTGGGRRLILFDHDDNDMTITNFRANSPVCIRCVRKATAEEISSLSFVDETLKPIVLPDYRSGRLRVLNLAPGVTWRVFSLLGGLLAQGDSGDGGELSILLPPLPPGIYTLSTPQAVVKWIYR